jgi:hypothetical protein
MCRVDWKEKCARGSKLGQAPNGHGHSTSSPPGTNSVKRTERDGRDIIKTIPSKRKNWIDRSMMQQKGSAESQQLLSAFQLNTYKHEAPNNSEHVNSLEAISFLQINDTRVSKNSHSHPFPIECSRKI